MRELLAVATGGAIGAVARFVIAGALQRTAGVGFPIGTLSVNVLGSLLIGALYVAFDRTHISPETRLFLAVGFLGALTTFSTFSLETMQLLEKEQWSRAVANVGASVVLCIAGCALGMWLARRW